MTIPIVSWIRAALLRAAGRDRNGNPHQPPADSIPLRAELFSGEQLQRHARTLAGQHRLDPRHGPNRLLARLAENEQVLVQTYDLVTAAEARGLRVAPAGEWLLDNYYLDRAADPHGAAAPAEDLQPGAAAPADRVHWPASPASTTSRWS